MLEKNMLRLCQAYSTPGEKEQETHQVLFRKPDQETQLGGEEPCAKRSKILEKDQSLQSANNNYN